VVCVGSAEEAESVVGPDAVGIALLVETVKVGRSCAAALEMAMIAKAARRKRADGDMRRVTVGRIAKDMFNTVSPLNQRRRSGSIDDSVALPDMRSLESKCDGYVYSEYFKVAYPLLVGWFLGARARLCSSDRNSGDFGVGPE
jgi:hypothetical protein